MADCLSRWAYPAGRAWMDICSHGDAEETEEAKRIIEMEKAMEQEGVKCFVVMANRTDLAKFRGARVQAIREKTLEHWMVAPVELVRSVLTEDWSDDYAASEHWSKYWNAVSAPSDDEWPEGLTEDGDEFFLKDKLLVPENRVEELIDHWYNAQLMHPGRDKMQQDLEWRFKFPPGYYAILDRYCSDCAVCRATKSPNYSTAGNPVYTAIPEAPMRSVAMDVFAMPEVTVEGETYDCVILAVNRHSRYIVAVPGKKSKKKDKKDKHGVGLQAKTVANAMIRHWLTICDVPAVICSDRGSQFVGTWFKTMCKHMGIRHAKVRVGDNKILDCDHTQLRPRAPDPSGRPVTFDFTAGDVDSEDEGGDDDFTAEKILADKPDPGTPGGRLYKVRWKGFAASRDSWEPPSSFVPRYTTVWMDYLRKKKFSLDVKDVLVHLLAAAAP